MWADIWAAEKAHDNKLYVEETRMLRWMCAVTELDMIRNEEIGEITSGINIQEGAGKEV